MPHSCLCRDHRIGTFSHVAAAAALHLPRNSITSSIYIPHHLLHLHVQPTALIQPFLTLFISFYFSPTPRIISSISSLTFFPHYYTPYTFRLSGPYTRQASSFPSFNLCVEPVDHNKKAQAPKCVISSEEELYPIRFVLWQLTLAKVFKTKYQELKLLWKVSQLVTPVA